MSRVIEFYLVWIQKKLSGIRGVPTGLPLGPVGLVFLLKATQRSPKKCIEYDKGVVVGVKKNASSVSHI